MRIQITKYKGLDVPVWNGGSQRGINELDNEFFLGDIRQFIRYWVCDKNQPLPSEYQLMAFLEKMVEDKVITEEEKKKLFADKVFLLMNKWRMYTH